MMVLFLGACKDKPGSLELKFIATYDGEPLVLGESVDYDGYQLNFLESEFIISDVSLSNGSERTEVKDFDFVNFTGTNFNLENAENGFSLIYSDIDAGSYNGMQFGIGVPQTENATNPSDYTSDHVLSMSGYYWSAWDSYIFTKLAGKYEDEEGSFDNGFLFHTGLDELYRMNEASINIEIEGEKTTVVEIYLDHKKLLELQGEEYYDIQTNSVNHDPTDLEPLSMIVDNYSQAISYK